jgi:hypothetical protein
MENYSLYAAAAVGLVLQEIMQWYALRAKLSKTEHKNSLRSATYWTVVGLMIVFGAAGCFFWMAGETQLTN